MGEEGVIELVDKLRSDLTPPVYEATINALRQEVERPDFDPANSPLLEGHGEGSGALLLLIHELLGFGREAVQSVVKEA